MQDCSMHFFLHYRMPILPRKSRLLPMILLLLSLISLISVVVWLDDRIKIAWSLLTNFGCGRSLLPSILRNHWTKSLSTYLSMTFAATDISQLIDKWHYQVID